jgi:predicted signal transduction protein with EAL and GGDEF domain
MADGGWISTHEDISDRMRIQAEIAHMAHHDVLTDLPNRALLRERMLHLLQNRRKSDKSWAASILDKRKISDAEHIISASLSGMKQMQVRTALEQDLRRAIINREFKLYYQPLVNLERKEISGFEALLLWNKPG